MNCWHQGSITQAEQEARQLGAWCPRVEIRTQHQLLYRTSAQRRPRAGLKSDACLLAVLACTLAPTTSRRLCTPSVRRRGPPSPPAMAVAGGKAVSPHPRRPSVEVTASGPQAQVLNGPPAPVCKRLSTYLTRLWASPVRAPDKQRTVLACNSARPVCNTAWTAVQKCERDRESDSKRVLKHAPRHTQKKGAGTADRPRQPL